MNKSRQTQTQLKRSLLSKTALCVLALVGLTAADQPVHCYKDQVLGDWTFKVTKNSKKVELFETESVCTHELPNKLQIITQGHKFQFEDETNDYKITLQDKNLCTASSSATGEFKTCHWTMMYDQAFLIHLPNQDMMANFKYEVKENSKPWEDLQTGDYDEFHSKCGRTMVGVVKHQDKTFSCMYGKMTSQMQMSSMVDDRQGATMKPTQQSYAQIGNHGWSFAQTAASYITTPEAQPVQLAQTRTSSGTMRTLGDVPEDVRIQFAQTINEAKDLTWEALAYTQVDMERLENQHAMSFAQTGSTWPPSQEVLTRAQKYIQKQDSMTQDDLPDEFDWSNFEGTGIDFTGEMRDQKSCGSCYMIATITMLESRIKLFYGAERTLSAQFPLQCNFLTEGCHGGWGFLGGLFLEAFWTVAEHDAAYKAKTEDHHCQDYKNAKPIASVNDTYYVGGGYGQMTEEKIMKEIRANGPVLYDFNAGYEFMTYSKGILKEQQLPHGCTQADLNNWRNINTLSQEEKGIQYQKLTHSTLVVGWGVRDGMKYWKVRNSYGGHWGEGGYFLVRRGNNDFGGEGENAAVIPNCFDCGPRAGG